MRTRLSCTGLLLTCRGCGAFLGGSIASTQLQTQQRSLPTSYPARRAAATPLLFTASLEDDEVEQEEAGIDAEELANGRLQNVKGGTMIDPHLLEDTKLFSPNSVKPGFKAGFVTIIGSPNVGKSTLMNAMIGDKLSIVTAKMQTTRHRIMGILTNEDFQAIFSDTPGVLLPAYRLHEGMMEAVRTALGDADVLLLLTDVFEEEFPDPETLRRIEASGKPLVVAVNKVDTLPGDGRPGAMSLRRLEEVRPLQETLDLWQARFPQACVLPISALEGINTDRLVGMLAAHLPESPPLYADDVMSDRPLRFFAAEIIREQIFEQFGQEIPYSCEVVLEKFEDKGERAAIRAAIVVNRDSQKGIIIGKGGQKIKEVGTEARLALEKFLDRKVRLDLTVKVDKDWRSSDKALRSFGYLP